MDQPFSSLMHLLTRSVEFAGVLVIVCGIAIASVRFLRRPGASDGYRALRSGIGRSILLGLEFLVAADIVNTVAIDPTLESVGVLGGIVLIRTFLSLSLEVEIEGRWPWQRQAPRRDGRESASA
jgi:uncharacterized membrane protein